MDDKKTKRPTVLLRWKRVPRETGLRAIVQGPRGWRLFLGNKKVCSVSPLFAGYGKPPRGWYACSPSNPPIPYLNTCDDVGVSPADALRRGAEHVLKHLSEADPGTIYKVVARIPGLDPEGQR